MDRNHEDLRRILATIGGAARALLSGLLLLVSVVTGALGRTLRS